MAVTSLVAAMALSAAACGGRLAPAGPPPTSGNAIAVEVIDGDTVVVEVGGRTERVRLIGVDTPETRDPRRPAECFGAEASEFVRIWAPPLGKPQPPAWADAPRIRPKIDVNGCVSGSIPWAT